MNLNTYLTRKKHLYNLQCKDIENYSLFVNIFRHFCTVEDWTGYTNKVNESLYSLLLLLLLLLLTFEQSTVDIQDDAFDRINRIAHWDTDIQMEYWDHVVQNICQYHTDSSHKVKWFFLEINS